MRPIRTVVQTLAIALAACLVAAGSAGAEMRTLTPNLVVNPGAELGSSGQGGVVTSIPGWTREDLIGSKLSTVVDYGAPGFPTLAQGAALGGGSHFFAGGPADGHDDDTPAFSGAVLGQDIDIERGLPQRGGCADHRRAAFATDLRPHGPALHRQRRDRRVAHGCGHDHRERAQPVADRAVSHRGDGPLNRSAHGERVVRSSRAFTAEARSVGAARR
jgi:hypothetical protein